VYGEVFMYKCPTTHQPIVLKIIPIEGDLLVNGEPQKRFDEILQEIVISMELSNLRNGKEYATDGFVNVKRVTCVEGAYPQLLIDEWELFRDNRAEGSDNDHPEVFGDDQLYVVFELCNGGKDLEAFIFNNAAEAQSVFLQVSFIRAIFHVLKVFFAVFFVDFIELQWVSENLVHFVRLMTRLHTHPLRLRPLIAHDFIVFFSSTVLSFCCCLFYDFVDG
jgi:Haspin like kinase domain